MPFAPRQIHLDFHTSSLIPAIGAVFDAERFIKQLQRAEVTSITCFARCHHGMIYYPSKIHSAAIHPHLQRDLLGEQLQACKAAGIKAPVYMPIQWDQFVSENFPQWCMRTKTGQDIVASWSNPGYFEDGFYTFLCVNSDYRQYVFDEVEELQQRYPIDGFFFDIVYPRACYCINCIKKMQAEKVDMNDEEQVLAFSVKSLAAFKHELSRRVWAKNPNATVYYNTSHVHSGYRAFLDAVSHIEVESLPSGGWGYDHFPVVGRYARTLGKPVMGMTAKFHTYWGDFHSLKNAEALQYECFLINAMGAYVSVGDQMHPDGQLSEAGYRLIGDVFRRLKAVEPYSHNVVAVTEMAVLNPEENKKDADLNLGNALIGATRLLQECGFQFDIIDSRSDFCRYKLLVLPDNYRLTRTIADKLDAYLTRGGRLLCAGKSPFDASLTANWLQAFPVSPKGGVPFSPDFLQIAADYDIALPQEELVMYQGGVEIEVVSMRAKVLANTVAPYFNRKGRAFCSHQHSPSCRQISHPALVATENIVYFANPIFNIYAQKAPRWVRTLVQERVRALLGGVPLVEHNAPPSLIVTLNHQPERKRYILHLLHYVPEHKCKDLLIVESKLPLYDLNIKLNLPNIKRVSAVYGEGKIGRAECTADSLRFSLDKLEGYGLICLEYD